MGWAFMFIIMKEGAVRSTKASYDRCGGEKKIIGQESVTITR